eukprot:8640177-Karenia_brevis.AAC.1
MAWSQQMLRLLLGLPWKMMHKVQQVKVLDPLPKNPACQNKNPFTKQAEAWLTQVKDDVFSAKRLSQSLTKVSHSESMRAALADQGKILDNIVDGMQSLIDN